LKNLIVPEIIEQKIYLIRGQKVMLDEDLAILYGVPVKRLNEQVKRNKGRFPNDFMFKLKRDEITSLRSQFATLTEKKYDIYQRYAFTEQGVAMLSSVLNSDRAIQVNIQIMRTFIKLREILATHRELQKKIEEMEKRYDSQFEAVFATIRKMIAYEAKPKIKIGFKKNEN
jgi:hypothetical protein